MPPEDYTGNAKKLRQQQQEPKTSRPEKKVSKVVVSEVVVKKRTLGQKIRSLFVEADLRSVVRYVGQDVLVPAMRNLIVDSATKGVERMMYGESNRYRSRFPYNQGPRVTYQTPVSRGLPMRSAPPVTSAPRTRHQDDLILASREEAEAVLEGLIEIIDNFDAATVADLNELCGFPTSHIDNKWGWTALGTAAIRQVRDGYMLELPPPEPINQ